jgi:hypothetical protein
MHRDPRKRWTIYIGLSCLALGLALAPGYLLLCGHSSGTVQASYQLYRPATDSRPPETHVVEVPLSRNMNPIGFNIVARTPFRAGARVEAQPYEARLTRDGGQLWMSTFNLAHGGRKEAIAGTAFTLRLKTFSIDEDGPCKFSLLLPADANGITAIDLQVRRNVAVPNPWIVGTGFAFLAIVLIWALMPTEGHDPREERIGTKWYAE